MPSLVESRPAGGENQHAVIGNEAKEKFRNRQGVTSVQPVFQVATISSSAQHGTDKTEIAGCLGVLHEKIGMDDGFFSKTMR